MSPAVEPSDDADVDAAGCGRRRGEDLGLVRRPIVGYLDQPQQARRHRRAAAWSRRGDSTAAPLESGVCACIAAATRGTWATARPSRQRTCSFLQQMVQRPRVGLL
jgi:hypothetical protein